MTLTASEVVAQYLSTRRGGRGEYTEADSYIADTTRLIVAELPDGFRKRDVTNCVKMMTENAPELESVKSYRRTLVAGKTLDTMVENNEIVRDDDKNVYHHVSF